MCAIEHRFRTLTSTGLLEYFKNWNKPFNLFHFKCYINSYLYIRVTNLNKKQLFRKCPCSIDPLWGCKQAWAHRPESGSGVIHKAEQVVHLLFPHFGQCRHFHHPSEAQLDTSRQCGAQHSSKPWESDALLAPLACPESRTSGRSGPGGQNREYVGHAYENGHENLGLLTKRSSVMLYLA